PGGSSSRRTTCSSAPRRPPCGWAPSSRSARRRCRPPTGLAVCGWSPVPGSTRRGRRRPPGPRGRGPVDPARLAAYEVVRAVRAEGAYANLALPHVLARMGLDGRDAAFATELSSGTLRQQGTYDAVLTACVDRPLAKVEAKVLDALRLGCHQLLA